MASSGNFCTFNETYRGTTTLYDHVLSAGNTRMTQSNISGSNHACGSPGTHLFASGKFYWEAYMPANQTGGSHLACGILNVGDGATKSSSSVGLGISTGDIGINPANNVVKFSNVQTKDYTESAFSSGDILQVAVDADNGAIYFGKNNTFLGSSDPTSGSSKTGAGATWTPSSYAGGWAPSQGCQGGNGNAIYMNWGQDSTFAGARSAGGNADENGFGDFVYSPPSGYLALCSANLPTSSDIDPAETDDDFPGKNFNVVLFTGNGSTNAITGLGFQPDLIWGFTRDGAQDKRMIDSTRGGASRLYSNNGNTADTSQTAISAFGADGFTANGGYFNNDNTKECGAWCWRANGGTTSTNSDGSADTTVQANTAAGFSIFTFANSSGSKTLGHGLGKAPSMYVIRGIGEGTSWGIYHKSLGATKYVRWNSTNGSASSTAYFNDTEPTSSVLSVGSTLTGSSLLCYAWAEIEGYSKFTTYTGNGNVNGPYIYLGFRPRMIMLKRYDRNGDYWYCIDSARNTFNGPGALLTSPDNDITESNHGTSNVIDFLSNGFKMRTTGSGLNGSGGTWLVAAWADVPYKYNNTR